MSGKRNEFLATLERLGRNDPRVESLSLRDFDFQPDDDVQLKKALEVSKFLKHMTIHFLCFNENVHKALEAYIRRNPASLTSLKFCFAEHLTGLRRWFPHNINGCRHDYS